MSPRKGWGIGKREYNYRYNYPLSLSEAAWPTLNQIDESVRGVQRADRESWRSHKGTTALAEFDWKRLRRSKTMAAYNDHWWEQLEQYRQRRRRQDALARAKVIEERQRAMQAEWLRRRQLLVKNLLLEQERVNRESRIRWIEINLDIFAMEPPPGIESSHGPGSRAAARQAVDPREQPDGWGSPSPKAGRILD